MHKMLGIIKYVRYGFSQEFWKEHLRLLPHLNIPHFTSWLHSEGQTSNKSNQNTYFWAEECFNFLFKKDRLCIKEMWSAGGCLDKAVLNMNAVASSGEKQCGCLSRAHLTCHGSHYPQFLSHNVNLSSVGVTMNAMGIRRGHLSQTISVTGPLRPRAPLWGDFINFSLSGDEAVLDEARPPVQIGPFLCQSEGRRNRFCALLLIWLLFLYCLLCKVTFGQWKEKFTARRRRVTLSPARHMIIITGTADSEYV